jgi:hypothetical protein
LRLALCGQLPQLLPRPAPYPRQQFGGDVLVRGTRGGRTDDVTGTHGASFLADRAGPGARDDNFCTIHKAAMAAHCAPRGDAMLGCAMTVMCWLDMVPSLSRQAGHGNNPVSTQVRVFT